MEVLKIHCLTEVMLLVSPIWPGDIIDQSLNSSLYHTHTHTHQPPTPLLICRLHTQIREMTDTHPRQSKMLRRHWPKAALTGSQNMFPRYPGGHTVAMQTSFRVVTNHKRETNYNLFPFQSLQRGSRAVTSGCQLLARPADRKAVRTQRAEQYKVHRSKP